MAKFLLLLLSIGLVQCEVQSQNNSGLKFSEEQHDYWYSGEAEITSYELKQVRYGEAREGKAVLVFVTEPFSKEKLVKADYPKNEDLSVLKLNFTKKFNTGIYPYSMMTSSFFPIDADNHSLKITSSTQEWCGHTFMEMRNRKDFEIAINSYFENESSSFNLKKEPLEDDIWSIIRIAPEALPMGDIKMIPSFFYLRLKHQETKGYAAIASISDSDIGKIYTIEYPELDRLLSIQFENRFPYKIISWEETYYSGYGTNRKKMTTSATKIKDIKTAYWSKNKNMDADLRKELGL